MLQEDTAEAKVGPLAAVPRHVHFLRYNQSPERARASHEERERLEEERPFGGNEQHGDKASVVLEAGACRHIIERFFPERMLQRLVRRP